MITWSWGSRKGGVEMAKSMEERGGLTEAMKGRKAKNPKIKVLKNANKVATKKLNQRKGFS